MRLNCGSLEGDVLFLLGVGPLDGRGAVVFLSGTGTGKSLAGTELSSLVNVPCRSRGNGFVATGGIQIGFCCSLVGDFGRDFLGEVVALDALATEGLGVLALVWALTGFVGLGGALLGMGLVGVAATFLGAAETFRLYGET